MGKVTYTLEDIKIAGKSGKRAGLRAALDYAVKVKAEQQYNQHSIDKIIDYLKKELGEE